MSEDAVRNSELAEDIATDAGSTFRRGEFKKKS